MNGWFRYYLYLNIPFKTNATFAGLSASRRMK